MPRHLIDAVMKRYVLEDINRICVLAWGLIGDLFMRVPVIEALRQLYPNAHITVVVDPRSKRVLRNHPDVNEVLVFSKEKRPISKYLTTLIKNVLYLRRQHYDLSVDLYSSGSSPTITQWINARWRLGFDHTAALRKANNIHAPHPSFLATSWHLSLGRVLVPLGVESVRRGSTFICAEEDLRYAERFLHGISRPLIAINLGAGGEKKCWPVDRFVALAKRMVNDGYKILVFTNPGQEYLTEEFESRYGKDNNFIRVPAVSIDRVAALMQHCEFVITADTSILHLAMGVKVPFLGIFLMTHPDCVLPEDVLNVACFKEGHIPKQKSESDSPSDLSVDYVYAQAQKLVSLIKMSGSPRQRFIKSLR